MSRKSNIKALIFLFSLLLLMSAAVLVPNVAASNEPKTSQGVDLTIYVTDQQLPAVQNVTDDFLASSLGNGVDSVTVTSTGGDATAQLSFLQTLMQGGTATAAVIGLDVVWTAQFAENNWIIPLDSYLTANELDDYGSGIVQACIYDGTTYAYPYFQNLGILWYRKDLMDLHFGAGNWSEADFATWEGLKDTANYILNNQSGLLTTDDSDLVGYVGQFDAYEGGVVNFFEWAGSNGATNLVTSDGQVNIDTTAVDEAMDFLKALIPPQYTGVQGTDYIIPRNGLVHDEGSSVGKWLANESIFMRQWTFAYGLSLDNNMDFGIAPLPHFAGASNYKTSAVGGAILAVPTTTTGTARQAAVNLTKFMGDTVAQEAELNSDASSDPGLQPVGNFPALKSVYSSPPAGFEWIKNWTGQLDLTLSRPVNSKYPQISTVIADYFSDLLSCNKEVSTALSEMERDVNEILAGAPTVPAIPGFSIGILIIAGILTTSVVVILKKRNL
jgi:ABC-type glycerol-3-phosphate transport system substrate-binding protein